MCSSFSLYKLGLEVGNDDDAEIEEVEVEATPASAPPPTATLGCFVKALKSMVGRAATLRLDDLPLELLPVAGDVLLLTDVEGGGDPLPSLVAILANSAGGGLGDDGGG